MDTDGDTDLTAQIIGCAITVSNALGAGFIEKVYEAALTHELRKLGLDVRQQERVQVRYDGIVVGEYRADIIVAAAVILEVKAAKAIDDGHQAQMLNYLKATGIRVGLILNFGTPHLGIKRMMN